LTAQLTLISICLKNSSKFSSNLLFVYLLFHFSFVLDLLMILSETSGSTWPLLKVWLNVNKTWAHCWLCTSTSIKWSWLRHQTVSSPVSSTRPL
jgi:hypothetical protein